MTKPITPERFDRHVMSRGVTLQSVTRDVPVIIWTAGAIARRIGTSADFVRDTLAHEPGSPVRKVGGRLCAVEADLIEFFRPAS